MNKEIYISILLYILCCVTTKGQDPYYIKYGLEEGLPSAETHDIEIDSFGRVWIATDRGVSIYNGYEFVNLTTRDGLAHNCIFELIKDNNNNIWISSFDGSLCYYNGEQIIIPPIQKELKIFNTKNWIKDIIQYNDSIYYLYATTTSQRNKALSSLAKPLLKLNINNWSLSKIKKIEEEFKNNVFTKKDNTIIIDKKLNLLIPTKKIKDQNFHIINQKLNYYYYREHHTEEVNTYPSTLKINDPSQKVIYKSFENFTKLNVIGNQLWLCTEKNGITILNLDSGKITVEKKILQEYYITSVIEDRHSNLWVSTINNGIIYIPNYYILNDFKISELKIKPILIETNNDFAVLFEDHSSKINIVDKNYNLVKTHKIENHVAAVLNNDSLYLNNNTIINSIDSKLKIQQYPNAKHTIRSLRNFSWKSGIIINNNLFLGGDYGIKLIKDGEIIIDSKKYFGEKITKIYQEENNKIWIGTVNGMYSITNYDYTNILQEESKSNFFKNHISDIIGNNHGTWASSIGSGIARIKNGKIQNHFIDNLSSPLVNKIELQNDSTLWVGTNNGLDRITFTTNKIGDISISSINSFNTSDGLISNFIQDIHFWNNSMWLATKSGLMLINPDDISLKQKGPSIFIDSITSPSRKLDLKKHVELPYNENDINFNFTGISFRKPTKDKFYYYQLIKDNDPNSEWIKTNNRSLQIMNLSPGSYEFKIKTKNKYNLWSKSEAKYSFDILPHFTQTIWFKLLSISLLLFIFYFINKYREKQLLNNEGQKRLIQETELRAQKAELDALRGQMNPHFVYNAMNSIQNFIFKNEPENANYYLSMVSRLMRNSLEMSKLEFITLEEEFRFLNTYLELEQMRFENKFVYTFNISNNISMETTLPPLILQPLIENVVKHAFKGIKYKGNIELIFEESRPEQLKISIIDNGVGIDYSMKQKHNIEYQSLSTKIIQERIQIINSEHGEEIAKIRIEDRLIKEGISGTTVILFLPINKKIS